MPRRPAVLTLLLLTTLALAPTVAEAARPVATKTTPSGELRRIAVGQALRPLANGMCQVGINDPHFPMNYLFPPDDRYYTLIDPAACGCTGEGGLALGAAHVVLDFPEACSIPVTVAVVEAENGTTACPTPIGGAYLCPPVDHVITVNEAGAYDVTLPLPADCRISGTAFLLVTFREVGDCGSVPSLYVSFGCAPCTSWNDWPGGVLTDLCDGYLLGNPNMYVDSACYDVVPAVSRSWGRLKSIYR